jgi:hypothetical protein
MKKKKPIATALVGVASVLVLSGCAAQPIDDWSEPSDQDRYEESLEIQQEQEADGWSKYADSGPEWDAEEPSYGDDFESRCDYDPTFNYDWHDDMVCDGQRLYLLTGDDYVEYWELEQAAREWIAYH